jgi:hypothetical protein
MQKTVSLAAASTGYTLPYGEGCMVISSASTLTSTIQVSLADGIWEDFITSVSADGVHKIDTGAKCLVRLNVTAGSCTMQVLGQSPEKSR